MRDTNFPRWAYISLAAMCALIGLLSSAVTVKFFIIGLQRMESDVVAREALIAAGVLMVATELMTFGLAALLPAARLVALRGVLIVCGLLLLLFQAATIYGTQAAISQNSNSLAQGQVTRIAQLRESVGALRLAASGLRSNGAAQSQSDNAWTRQLGAKSLREALVVMERIEPMATELSNLEASQKANMTDVFGAEGVLWYNVARSILVSAMGLVMFGAAGSLLRLGWCVNAALQREAQPESTVLPIETQLESTVIVPESTVPTIESAAASAVSETGLDARFERVREAVMSGSVAPTVRSIQSLESIGTLAARRILDQLAAAGVTVRSGQGWRLAGLDG